VTLSSTAVFEPPVSSADRPTTPAVSSVPRGTIALVPRWGSDQPLVGRLAELTRLRDALDAASRGQPSAYLLAGDAGVGKTRLLAELAARARADGVRVVAGHCVDFGDGGLPYLAFTEILRSLAGTTGDDLAARFPALGPLLGSAPPGQDGAATKSHQLFLFDAVAEVLAEVAAESGLLLVVEDLHWADQSTRDLLRYLVSRLDRQQLFVVGSYRADDLHRRHPLRPLLAELARLPHVERILLPALPDADIAELVRRLGAELPAIDLARIVDRAGGNAFYAEQLLQAVVDHDAATLPGALADVLLARLEQLPGPANRVVRIAAVAGRQVQHELLSAAADLGDGDLDNALREAVARNVLVPAEDGTFAFRHALLREASYADLLPGERVRIHARFAQLLDDGRGPAAELAYHRRESHDLAGALTASVQAAEEARGLGAPAEQLHHLEAALRLWPAVPEATELIGRDEVSVMLAAANAAAQAGESARAVALTRAALERVESPTDVELTAKVRYTLAQNLLTVDLDQAAYAETSAALDLLPADPPSPVLVWAAATHVRTAFYVGDVEGARRAGEQALSGAEALGLDAAWAEAAISLARIEQRRGDPEQVTAQLQQAHERARRACDEAVEIRAAYNIALVRYELGDLTGALHWADLGGDRAAATGLGWSLYGAELRYLQAVVRYVAGDWDGSLRAADLTGQTPPVSARNIGAAGLLVVVGRGDPATARKVEQGLRASGDAPLALLTAGTCAVEWAAWSDPDQAVTLTERTMADVSHLWGDDVLGFVRLIATGMVGQADLVQAARRVGDQATVQRLTDRVQPLLNRARHLAEDSVAERGPLGVEGYAWVGRLEAEWSRLSGHSDPDQWRDVVAAFGYGHVYEQARGRWRLSEALVAADHRAEAAEHARSAYDVAVRLGARPLAEAVAGLVRRARLDAGLTGAAGTPESSPLTPREQDVLGLLTQGMTNRQIGRELYISEKTASVHVSNILAKLKASGRTEAVAIAHRRGLLVVEGS